MKVKPKFMNQTYLYFKWKAAICMLFFLSLVIYANSQETNRNRLNIEFGSGVSTFKNAHGESPHLAGNFTFSMWTPSENIYSLEYFGTSEIYGRWADSYEDYCLSYGKMLRFKKKGKGFVSIHGGAGYVRIFKKSSYDSEYNRNTLGLTAQVNVGLAFQKGWIGFRAFQKYSFVEANNIRGLSLQFSLNLSRAIPQ